MKQEPLKFDKSSRITQAQLESYLWGAATLLRGVIDAGDYKQFIFPPLFFKCLSDVYLPLHSPHLNIAETLWRKLKYEWLQATDYLTTEGLFYKVRQALAAIGKGLKIQFSEFSLGST